MQKVLPNHIARILKFAELATIASRARMRGKRVGAQAGKRANGTIRTRTSTYITFNSVSKLGGFSEGGQVCNCPHFWEEG